MADDNLLRQRVRDAIRNGELPGRPPDRLWGGPATGARCAICGQPTTDREFEFAYDGPGGSTSYFAHPRCMRVFEEEVEGRGGDPVDGSRSKLPSMIDQPDAARRGLTGLREAVPGLQNRRRGHSSRGGSGGA